ncbi:DNA methyltransferase [Anaerotignum lactatifermentans]|uniref:DNA methyltransferase n=1 Tax=Anaerotignum lactatifermentans TaxID=160404 RepID=UPI0018760E85|nr:DNA methyltransferase [Anaerotignum lactatifermentans]MBE5076474.1 DNA methylase [Anaerotignum lactatifermentans]
MRNSYSKAAAATFILNKDKPIHRWYPYLEGYSSCLIDDIVMEIGPENIHVIFDPFGGTGTTSLVASSHGIKSYYCETNPFMQQVIETKINCVKHLRESGIGSKYLKKFLSKLEKYCYQLRFDEPSWDGFEKFFDPVVLYQLKDLKNEIDCIDDPNTRSIALVLLASVTVRASKMIRQGDLRYAKETEKKADDQDILNNFICKLKMAINDIDHNDCPTLSETIRLADDCRDITIENQVDCVITSPPYLNGTNYIRNTKLELKLSGYIQTEKDLPKFHSKGIIAGINNVSSKNTNFKPLEIVQPYIEKVAPIAYDKRIPLMIAGYFHDMTKVIERLSHAMKDSGYFIMDIGDSQFAGVHIPTHEILTKICENYGFVLYGEDILRERRSKNGMILSQRLLKFRFHKKESKKQVFLAEAKNFMNTMPYKAAPYSGRNWGHPWHSLCSYHGKLKPAIAHFLIEQFTDPGDIVVDPLCGVGTIPLEACLQNRVGIGNDLSELAFCVTKAKVEKAEKDDCFKVLDELHSYIESKKNSDTIILQIQKYKNFGYNGKLPNYFHEDTFKEILCARSYFVQKIKNLSAPEAMVFSCLLHILHGNRPYALSRNSHPLTPYAPTGEFVYKNVIEHIKNKLLISYKRGKFETYCSGKAIYGDYQDLAAHNITANAIICSPPFVDSIKFYMQNWMRLWLCGWEESDYKKAENTFLDQIQKKDFDIYISFFEMCHKILKPNGKVILHLGKTQKVDMAEELSKRAIPFFDEVYRGTENVQEIEKHGIKDKGSTVEHQYLFLIKK